MKKNKNEKAPKLTLTQGLAWGLFLCHNLSRLANVSGKSNFFPETFDKIKNSK